nr:MAG TPA: hypothetical protein [Caudoviricetes sp.]DAS39955.1 MAG TPA: hypothetical protein [Caudoviricetes sp.]
MKGVLLMAPILCCQLRQYLQKRRMKSGKRRQWTL